MTSWNRRQSRKKKVGGETYGSNHMDDRPDRSRVHLFCVQQRLDLLHLLVFQTILHRRCRRQGRHLKARLLRSSGNSRVKRVRHSPSIITREYYARRRRRRCKQTQSRPSSPPSRSTMPSTPLSKHVLPLNFSPIHRNLTTRQSSVGL